MIEALSKCARAFVLVFALLMGTPVSAAQAPDNPRDAYNTLASLFRANQCPEALDLLALPSIAPLLAQLAEPVQIAIDAAALKCALRAHQQALALHFAIAGTEVKGSPPQLWQMRMSLEWRAGDHATAITTLETMGRTNPEALAAFDFDVLAPINSELKREGVTDLRNRLAKLFGAPGLHPSNPGVSVDGFRYENATSEAEAGHKEAAAAIFAQITSPALLIRATLDPRLHAFVPAGFDARVAVEREMEGMREVAAAHPDDLQPVLRLAGDYAFLDEGREMLALLLPVRPGKDHPEIKSTEAQARHWWTLVMGAYTMLGRYDDVIAALREEAATVKSVPATSVFRLILPRNKFALGTVRMRSPRWQPSITPRTA